MLPSLVWANESGYQLLARPFALNKFFVDRYTSSPFVYLAHHINVYRVKVVGILFQQFNASCTTAMFLSAFIANVRTLGVDILRQVACRITMGMYP